MKKSLLFITLITALSCSNIVHAQDDEKFLTLGLKAGLNISTLSGLNHKDYPGKTKSEVRFIGGITADFRLSHDWLILSGVEYVSKDTDTGVAEGAMRSNPYYRMKYLQAPIHLGYKIRFNQNSSVIFHAGPYFAYGTKGEIRWKDKDVFRYTDVFDKKSFDRFDYGLGAGISVENRNFSFNIGYDYGLKNIANPSFHFPDRPEIDTRVMSVHTRSLHFTIGWKFRQLAWYGIDKKE